MGGAFVIDGLRDELEIPNAGGDKDDNQNDPHRQRSDTVFPAAAFLFIF